MTLLINRTDISNYRQVSDTVFDNVLNQHVMDAQFVDLQEVLGADFYNDLIRNYTNSVYQTLLNGGNYTYQSVTYTNVGLKAVIVHYAYARYIMYGSQTDTPFGFVEKISGDSQQVSLQEKKAVYKMNQQTAYKYWENVRLFLDRNKTDYPLWKESCIKKGGFRIRKIN